MRALSGHAEYSCPRIDSCLLGPRLIIDETCFLVPKLISDSKHEVHESLSHDDAGGSPTNLTTSIPGSIFDNIEAKLSVSSLDEETQTLWVDIRAAFDEGGPSAVRGVIDDRVRQSRLAVEKDLKQTRSVAKSATPKKKASPAKKAAAPKKAKTK